MNAAYTQAVKQLFSDFERAQQINAENLKAILAENRDTVYGQRFGFAEIHSAEEYSERVPLTDYSAYEELVHVPNGMTAYPIVYMLMTSGTTNKQKLVPMTTEMLRRLSTTVQDMPFYLGNVQGKTLYLSVFRSPVDGKTLISSAYYHHLRDHGGLTTADYLGGLELLYGDDITDQNYVKLWLAFSCPELVHIQSIFLYDALLFFRYMQDNWVTVISDMRRGKISAELPDRVKAELLKHCAPKAELDRISAELTNGFDTPIATRIWKKLVQITGVGGKMFAMHEEALKGYIGDIPICHFGYVASEALMGVPVEMNKPHYAIVPSSAYYEFFSIENEGIVSMAEVEVGKQYAIVLTTFSGLYRYMMNDVITVVGFQGEVPVIEVTGRYKNLINAAGEKIDEATMREAIRIWAERMDLQLDDAAAGVDMHKAPSRYHIFVETRSVLTDAGQLAHCFDEALRSVSPDYDDVRKLRTLATPHIHLLPRGAISSSKAAVGMKATHSKPQVFLKEAQTEYLIKRSECNEEQ